MSNRESSLTKRQMLRENPEVFVEKILGHDPWETPREILRSIAKPSARVAIKACHSSGKCIPAHEPVMLADGSRVPAHTLVGTIFQVLTPSKEGNVRVPARAEWNGIEQTIAVTTASGREISRSMNHPLWVAQKPKNATRAELMKWLPISEIRPGDYVAVTSSFEGLKLPDTSDYEDWEVKLLAYHTGNMGISAIGPYDREVENMGMYEYVTIVRDLGDDMIPDPSGFVREFPFEISSSPRGCKSLDTIVKAENLENGPNHRRVPLDVFTLPLKQQQLFLSRLFTFGGYIDETSRYRIYYYSSSDLLVRDVQHLLLVQGILSNVERIDNLWRLNIDSAWTCIDFLKRIGIHAQEEKCIEALNWLEDYVEQKEIERPGQVKPNFPQLHKGLMWDLVTEIHLSGICATVALEVPEKKTYLGEFWEHNTHTCADAALWFVCTGGIVITTAPSWPQVEKLLWGEIHRTYGRVGHLIGGDLLQTELRMPGGAYAFGLSTNEGINFQGHHDRGGGVLVIIDEAPGVKPDIWEAIEGIRAGGDVRILAPGNPVKAVADFAEAFSGKGKGWIPYTISAFDTPNFKGVTLDQLLKMSDAELDNNVRPYLTTRRWVRDKYYEWGPNDPRWIARVMGEFPDKSTADLLAKSWVEGSKRRALEPDLSAHVQAGIDVAGEGSDETVLTIRKGKHILECKGWGDEDPRDQVSEMLSYWRARDTLIVAVDSIGLGHYFVKFLEDEGFTVVAVNASEKPIDDLIWIWSAEPHELPTRRFGNLKAQLYWGLREQFQSEQITGMERCPPQMMEQLLTIRWFEDERSGKIFIEPKKSLKKRGFNSPDYAESLMLAFASVGIQIPTAPLLQSSSAGWGF